MTRTDRIPLGLSTFVLASPFSDDDLQLLAKARAWGYDHVEVCIEDPSLLKASAVARAASDEGLNVLVCGAFGPQRDVSHEDAGMRSAARDYLMHCVEFAHEVGSPLVSGPMYATTGQARLLEPVERQAQWDRAVQGLRQVGEAAAAAEVTLAVEPLNRFETDLVNTVEQGVRLCEDIGLANVGLMLDTFHMNIEEKSLPRAIVAAGTHIVNFQVSENDRGTPGTGHTPWAEVIAALRAVGYPGGVVVESFLPTVKEIAKAVSLWRPVAPSMDALAGDSVEFLHPLLAST
ncbi:MAG: D-psicose/D-tagatose/L-ribulose 3-epimerase [Pseudonocardiales bacterium]|nr:D-psicose/D-tagatose/L-ribulose 3-epimerase [Pseudonocardiales bacterium]